MILGHEIMLKFHQLRTLHLGTGEKRDLDSCMELKMGGRRGAIGIAAGAPTGGARVH
jgi:hypothetical protein